jgi:hypothetical protein
MMRSDLTDALFGYTIVIRIEFSTDLSDFSSTLTLELAKSDKPKQGEAIRAVFEDVSHLHIKDSGGGQFQLLLIEDISDQYRDRLYYPRVQRPDYRVHEAENDSILFLCCKVTIMSIGEV